MRRLMVVVAMVMLTGGSAALGCSASKGGSEGEPELVPRAGQAIVTGLADRIVAEGAQGDTITTPFTISARERGTANMTIENALVAGARVAINWNGGTPLPISGAGGLDLGSAHLEVDGGGVTWGLDGAPREFVPGSYRAGASVGVGPSGIATPREAVDFQADDRTLLTSRGGTLVRLPPRQATFTGPGTVTLTGQLRVRKPEGKTGATQVMLRDGPYEVKVVPEGNRLRVNAILQGPVTSS